MGPETQLNHDHEHLDALLQDLARTIDAWGAADDPEGDPLAEVREILGLFKEDTYEHFEREEHGLFPNLRADFPDLDADLDAMQRAHDAICQQIETLDAALTRADADRSEATIATARQEGARLEQLHRRHTAHEWGVIRRLLERLDDDRRAVILEQLREI